MCDDKTNRDAEKYLRRSSLTRREFNRRGAGAALAMLLPPVANALEVAEQDVLVETPDGMADCYFVHPASGKHAAVILWPDIMGIRPAFRLMGKRLAQSGYAVLVVNPYYRTAKGTLVPDAAAMTESTFSEVLRPLARSLSPQTCVTDGRAFVDYLDGQPVVDTGREIGTMGYCMTGSYTMRLAAAIPERIGAGGSFHGGGLVSEEDDSPHLLVPQMKAGFLIAIAENDHERYPEARDTLRKAFDDSGLNAEIEVYEGALHGWCPLDSRVYNEAQAERAWNRLLALFERELA